ncbi:sialate O-acetylesterase [Haloferula chungangensis]|uniref:Sialate O-acetylesterase n=1 Tax=Haloferula chungangensis TaxID=1048331 RepID=A0ABW2L2L5_9BACT
MKFFQTLLVALLLTHPVLGAIKLPHLFSDGAVLQRDRSVPVWGWAQPGKKVTVEFAGQKKATKANDYGAWNLKLDAMPASAKGRVLVVTEEGSEPVRVNDLLIGEVWLASGQSNMEWPISKCRPEDQAIANSGPVEHMRIFNVPNKLSPHPLYDVDSKWQLTTPESVKNFSGVAYFFGRELSHALKVPIGIISSEWGGSRIEPWIPEVGFAEVSELTNLHRYRKSRLPGTKEYEEAAHRHLAATRAWIGEAHKALKRHQTPPAQPPAPAVLSVGHNAELGLYQAMIHPLQPYALRGFIWYQGESNLADGLQYRWKMEALIKGWRTAFQNREAPFLFTQLAPFNYGRKASLLPQLWVAQRETLEVPHTGMAIINDIGNPKDIHPTNKSDVGHRLARLALADSYGKKDLVKSGPLFRDFTAKDGKITISFDHAGSGLKTRDGKAPDSFEIAGANGKFHPAQADVDGDKIVLHSDQVPDPTQARFAWSQTASPNLVNSADLPTSAFHTHWPHDPELGRNVALGKPHTSSDPNKSNWNSGLTDGSWKGEAGQCFATGSAPLPKHATIDLLCTKQVHAVRVGAPAYGSTKTIAVSVSANGDAFEEVGRYTFKPKTDDKTTIRFEKRPARHVRITFLEQHPKQDKYAAEIGFIREVEVFESK